MANYNDINKRVKNIGKTQKVMKAMYLISSIQMQKTKAKFMGTKEFFDRIANAILDILESDANLDSSYLEIGKNKHLKKIYIVLSSDNGLVGQYNFNLVKYLDQLITDKDNAIILMAGYMGKKLLKKSSYNIDKEFNFFINKPTYLRSQDIIDYLIKLYNDQGFDEVYIIYNDLVNSFTQKIAMVKLFPLEKENLKKNLQNDVIERNKNIINYEPSVESVFDNLMLLYLNGVMYDILVDAYISEQAARVITMNKADKNADDILRKLKLLYNKKRQEKITRDINEIATND